MENIGLWAASNAINQFIELQLKTYICLPTGRSVWWKTVTEGLKMLPEVTVFHHMDRPKPASNMFIFFFLQLIGFAADYKWVYVRTFVIESAGAPSTNDL